MSATAFIGGGRITSALIAGLRKAKHKGAITVHDRNPEKLRALQRDFGVATEGDLCAAVAKADMLILAVRPSSVVETLHSFAPFADASNPLVVSLSRGSSPEKAAPPFETLAALEPCAAKPRLPRRTRPDRCGLRSKTLRP